MHLTIQWWNVVEMWLSINTPTKLWCTIDSHFFSSLLPYLYPTTPKKWNAIVDDKITINPPPPLSALPLQWASLLCRLTSSWRTTTTNHPTLPLLLLSQRDTARQTRNIHGVTVRQQPRSAHSIAQSEMKRRRDWRRCRYKGRWRWVALQQRSQRGERVAVLTH